MDQKILEGNGLIQGVQIGSGNKQTNNYGVSIEKYTSMLEKKQTEITCLLVDNTKSTSEIAVLKNRLELVQEKLINVDESYQEHVKDLKSRIKQLEKLNGKAPAELLRDAKKAMIDGDSGKAKTIFTQIEDQSNPHIIAAAEAIFQKGKLYADEWDFEEGSKCYIRSIELNPDNTIYLESAGGLYYELGKYEASINVLNKALKIHQDAGSALGKAKVQYLIANSLGGLGNNYEAKKYLDKASQILLLINQGNTVFGSIVLNSYGMLLVNSRHFEDAITYLEKAISIERKLSPINNFNLGIRYNNLGLAFKGNEKAEKAIEYFEKAIQLGVDNLNEKDASIAKRKFNLATYLHELGRYSEALIYYKEILKSDTHLHRHQPIMLFQLYKQLGTCLYLAGTKNKIVIEQIEESLDNLFLAVEWVKQLNTKDPRLESIYSEIIQCYRFLRNFDDALNYSIKSLAISKINNPPNSINVGIGYNNLGRNQLDLGEYKEAVKNLSHALDIVSKNSKTPEGTKNIIYNNLLKAKSLN